MRTVRLAVSCATLSYSLSPAGVAWARRRVCFNPTLSTGDRARGLLDNSLKDKNPDTRMHAVQALGLAARASPTSHNSRPCWTTKTSRCGWPPSRVWWT